MKALILAAGYATRLYPLTKEFPKPLLEVEKKPIIDYIVEKIEGLSAIDEILVVTNSKFVGQFKVWAQARASSKPIRVIDDLTTSNDDRLGAIGDIHFALQDTNLCDDLLVIGGDNLFEDPLHDFLAFAQTHRSAPSIGIYDIQDITHANKYGVVKLSDDQRVVDFQEKPAKPQSTLVAMCVYYFPCDKLGLIKEYLTLRQGKHDATGFYIDWLRQQVPVYAFLFKGRWYDIGDHAFYHKANTQFNKGGV
ncbi:MAG: nucleotidyltransferase family protein [Candidatus Omnitrophica bacterium]|nr:nucleotidyltransferase family protein [Candidatus Omnitrophota bacterium]